MQVPAGLVELSFGFQRRSGFHDYVFFYEEGVSTKAFDGADWGFDILDFSLLDTLCLSDSEYILSIDETRCAQPGDGDGFEAGHLLSMDLGLSSGLVMFRCSRKGVRYGWAPAAPLMVLSGS